MTGLLVIIEELKEEHGSINAAARAVGMPQATLHNIYNGAQDRDSSEEPRLDTLRPIARYRHQPLWKLIRDIEGNGKGNGGSH